jgi:hypothetical protein
MKPLPVLTFLVLKLTELLRKLSNFRAIHWRNAPGQNCIAQYLKDIHYGNGLLHVIIFATTGEKGDKHYHKQQKPSHLQRESFHTISSVQDYFSAKKSLILSLCTIPSLKV